MDHGWTTSVGRLIFLTVGSGEQRFSNSVLFNLTRAADLLFATEGGLPGSQTAADVALKYSRVQVQCQCHAASTLPVLTP
jgi:hypothetical protein